MLTTDSIDEQRDIDSDWYFDAHEIESFNVDAQGFLHINRTTLSTVGVYSYRKGGKLVRAFRPPAEVQSDRFMKSLRNAIVTDEHPIPRGTPVTIRNVKKLQVGSSGSDVAPSKNGVTSSLVVTDSRLVNTILERRKQGLRTGVSVGYRSKTRDEPGVWQGKPYDVVQYGQVANHISITTVPRGGLDAGGTVMHLDSFDGETNPTKKDSTMEETTLVTVGGIQIAVLTAHVPLLQDKLNSLDSQVKAGEASIAEAAKALGETEAKLEAVTKEKDALTVDSKVNVGELVAARVALTEKVLKIVDADKLGKIETDSEDYDDKVIALCLDSHGIDIPKHMEGEAANVYARARFDGLVATAGKDSHKKLSSSIATRGRVTTDSKDEDSDSRKALNERFKKSQEARSAKPATA